MNIVPILQELDALIIEHTRPPITAILRNHLSVALEQAEAHSGAVARQDQTLTLQAQEIERLMVENKKLVATIAQFETDNKQSSADAFSQEKAAIDALYDPEE